MNDTYTGKERRANKRVRMNCTVTYRANEPATTRFMMGSNDVQAKMIDISQSGMSLVTDYDIPVSTVLSMRFTVLKVNKDIVSFSGPMEITGEVKSNQQVEGDGHRLGIHFSEMRKINVS